MTIKLATYLIGTLLWALTRLSLMSPLTALRNPSRLFWSKERPTIWRQRPS